MSESIKLSAVQAPPKESAKEAGQQLEAFFMRRMLAEMRATVGEGMFSGGYSGEMFQDMLDEAMADEMSAAGGLGIAEMIQRELGEDPSLAVSAASEFSMSAPGGSGRSESGSDMLPDLPPVSAKRVSQVYASTRKAHSHGLRDMPVQARVSSTFGRRVHPVTGAKSFHEGIDLAAVKGTEVATSGPGVVVKAGKAGTYGNLVIVDHGGGLQTRYAHLDSIEVQVGQQLAAGQSIGKVGDTGRVTGAHLHFEVRRNGKAIDPKTLLSNTKESQGSSQE